MQDTDLQDLQKDTFVIVIVLVVALALTFAYVMLVRAYLFDENDFLWWLPSVLTLATCGFSYKLYKGDRFRRGTYVFIGGLILSITSFMLWPHLQFSNFVAYLLVLVVAMAGLLINPQAAAQAANFVAVVTLGTAFVLHGLHWEPFISLLPPLAVTYAMAAVSWVSSNHLTTTLKWAMDSQERAQQRSLELFESQQELKKAYFMLETANVRLKQAEAEAVQANEFKTRFITSLSHELRTPLSAIINFSYILSRKHHGEVTQEQSDYLTRIYDAGNLLLEIVNDLLDLAKVESGQMDIFQEPIDLVAIGAAVITTISGLIGDKPVELRQEISPNLPDVSGDETRIRQILLNLLGNAVKYTEAGHITLRISQDNDDFVKVSVSDTGMGISASAIRGWGSNARTLSGSSKNSSRLKKRLPYAR
jgi:signal transduction histidine kinase